MLRVEEIENADDLDAWAQGWDALARECEALYFQTPDWVTSWWRTLEPGSSLVLIVDGPQESPAGILALSRLRRKIHPRVPVSLPFVGFAGSGLGAADALGPVTTDDRCADRLISRAIDVAGRTPIVFDNVAPRYQRAIAGLEGVVTMSHTPRPGLDLGGVSSADQLWSAKVRKSVRRRERMLADAGGRRRWVQLTPDNSGELVHLERLHNALWASRGRPGLFGRERMALLVDLAARSTSTDGPWLQIIELQDRPVAALLGFRFGATFCSYKTGWDPGHHALGLGVQLHSAAIGWAHDAGIRRYEFLRGANNHKYSLGGHDRVDTTFMIPTGFRGRQLLARDRISLRRNAVSSWPAGR